MIFAIAILYYYCYYCHYLQYHYYSFHRYCILLLLLLTLSSISLLFISWLSFFYYYCFHYYFEKVKANSKRLNGGGRDCLDTGLEKEVVCYVYNIDQNMLHVSRKIIMPKAKKIFGKKTTDCVCRGAFAASWRWWEKFMRGRVLSLQRKTTIVQRDHYYLTVLLLYFLNNAIRLQCQNKFATQILRQHKKLFSETIWYLKLLLNFQW